MTLASKVALNPNTINQPYFKDHEKLGKRRKLPMLSHITMGETILGFKKRNESCFNQPIDMITCRLENG